MDAPIMTELHKTTLGGKMLVRLLTYYILQRLIFVRTTEGVRRGNGLLWSGSSREGRAHELLINGMVRNTERGQEIRSRGFLWLG